MKRLTMREVNEKHGGKIPPDATLRPDEQTVKSPPPAKKRRVARSDRFGLLNAFIDFDLANLTMAEVKVWFILFRDTKADSGIARTGQEDIARRAGISSRSVRSALANLETRGLVSIVKRGRLNGGPSSYRVSRRTPA